MSRQYYPHVGYVDPDRDPHLATAAEAVSVMYDSIFPPWRWPAWRRAHRVWTVAQELAERRLEVITSS